MTQPFKAGNHVRPSLRRFDDASGCSDGPAMMAGATGPPGIGIGSPGPPGGSGAGGKGTGSKMTGPGVDDAPPAPPLRFAALPVDLHGPGAALRFGRAGPGSTSGPATIIPCGFPGGTGSFSMGNTSSNRPFFLFSMFSRARYSLSVPSGSAGCPRKSSL